jgi:hypothetical protein
MSAAASLIAAEPERALLPRDGDLDPRHGLLQAEHLGRRRAPVSRRRLPPRRGLLALLFRHQRRRDARRRRVLQLGQQLTAGTWCLREHRPRDGARRWRVRRHAHALEPLGHSPLDPEGTERRRKARVSTKIATSTSARCSAIPLIQTCSLGNAYTDYVHVDRRVRSCSYWFCGDDVRCTREEAKKLGRRPRTTCCSRSCSGRLRAERWLAGARRPQNNVATSARRHARPISKSTTPRTRCS